MTTAAELVRSAATRVRGLQLVALAVLVVFPLVVTGSLPVFVAITIGIYLLVAIALNFLMGVGGQVSLGHGALVGVGAYVTGILTVQQGWSFWAAGAAAAAVTGVVGLLMGVPSFRLSKWYFALITLFFALVVEGLIGELGGLTGGYAGLIGIPMPSIGDLVFTGQELYWLVLALNLVVFVAINNIVRTRFGRALVAVRDGGEAAPASGISVRTVKLKAFVLSAVIAGIAGALFAAQQAVLTPTLFNIDFSIFFLVVVVLGGAGRRWGPVVGTLVFFALPELLQSLAEWRLLIYGIGLLVLMVFAPHGLIGLLEDATSRLRRRAAPARTRPAEVTDRTPEPPRTPDHTAAALRVHGVRKAFGGVQALDGVSVDVPAGAVTAIVGSNGSGKTTLLNAVSGFYRVDEGTIELDGLALTGHPPERIARMGVGRTFQTPKLLSGLSVLDNVLLGAHSDGHATLPEMGMALPRSRSEEQAWRGRAMHLLEFVGLADQAAAQADELPHGHLRLLEIARALLAEPRLLLLDEPAAGLALSELDLLMRVVDEAVRDRNVTVVIVEHHLEVVRRIARTAFVFDRGKVLAAGSTADVLDDASVADAYMGKRR
ncbi:MAG: hypothetical protein ABS81_02435 [Pseudonocardia sp. SCN 72-86]|nr:MAG: hypothetical protein ABS81_02435 [Pseudonocardia sp. SCN 72-86]